MSIKKKLVSNTVYNFIGKIFGIIVSIILIPYILDKIGKEAFGIWAIVFMIGGYLGLFDFGTKWAYQKYIAEYNKKNDTISVNKIVNTGLFFYFIVFTALFIGLFFLRNEVVSIFKVSDALKNDFSSVFVISLASFVLLNIFSVFIHIPIGLQRMDISNKIIMFSTFLNCVGTFVFLSLGFKLKGLVINNLIVNIIQIVISLIVSFKLLKELKLKFKFVDRSELKKIFGFGVKNQIASMHEIASFQTDKLFIGNYISLVFVSFYEIGTKFLIQVRFVCSLIISAVVPAVSELHVENDHDRILRLYSVVSKYIVTIIIPMFFILNFYAKDIINIWVGNEFFKALNVIYILSIGYFFNCIAGTGYVIAIGMGRPDINMRFGILGTVLNLILSFTLIRIFGVIGLLIGTSFTLIVSGSYLMTMFHKLINIKLIRFWAGILTNPILAIIIAGSFGLILNKFVILGNNRILMLISLIIKTVLIVSIYIVFLFVFKYYTLNDIKEIKNMFKKRTS